MTTVDLKELAKGIQAIQIESLNDGGVTMWFGCNHYTRPKRLGGDGVTAHPSLDVTLFIGNKKGHHSYQFYDWQTPAQVWEKLDDMHKRFRKRPVLRDLVKELKANYKG